MDEKRSAPGARGEPVSTDERDSQLSAMFDGELPDSECELLARRLSRDPALQQQWSRYSLIGAVVRNEPLHARRAPGGRVAAGIAARLSSAIEAEAAVAAQPVVADDEVATLPGVANGTSGVVPGVAGRWVRPAAGFAIAAGVAALSVFWLQGRAPVTAPGMAAAAAPGAANTIEVLAPAVTTGGPATEVVVANNVDAAASARRSGSGEPESYVVPMPTERPGMAAPAQLANYVVAHSEYSAPLSRRSLLSALVAADGVPVEQGAAMGEAAAVADPADDVAAVQVPAEAVAGPSK